MPEWDTLVAGQERQSAPASVDNPEVVDALRRLPENQRVVLVLHYFADRQVHQIADSRTAHAPPSSSAPTPTAASA